MTDGPKITAVEIPWQLDAVERIEDADIMSLSVSELLAYAADLQREAYWQRQLAHESTAMIAEQRDQLARAARVNDALRGELRTLREKKAE